MGAVLNPDVRFPYIKIHEANFWQLVWPNIEMPSMEAFGLLRRVTCGLFRAVLKPDVRFPYVRARKTCFLAAHMAQHKRNMAPGRPSIETLRVTWKPF